MLEDRREADHVLRRWVDVTTAGGRFAPAGRDRHRYADLVVRLARAAFWYKSSFLALTDRVPAKVRPQSARAWSCATPDAASRDSLG